MIMLSNLDEIIASSDLEKLISEKLFNIVPVAIAIIDCYFNMVYVNQAFEKTFGPWHDMHCFTAYKKQKSYCQDCKLAKIFEEGVPKFYEEVGFTREGNLIRYINHSFPVISDDGEVHFVLVMSTDITQVEWMMRKERQLLFDRVPCNIEIIDRQFRILSANKRVRDTFGNVEGKHCYFALKGKNSKCENCTADLTFLDGHIHTGYSMVRDKFGKKIYLQDTTMPLDMGDKKFEQVMVISVDITHVMELEEKLKIARQFRKSMISTSKEGIIAINRKHEINIFNPTARKMFNMKKNYKLSKENLELMLPKDFMNLVFSSQKNRHYLPETQIKDINGKIIPVRLTGIKVKVHGKYLGMVFWLTDLREIKQLEAAKVEAERLAAVGQTVAGLAHVVKNLLTGLEGGIFMLVSGLEETDIEGIQSGVEMITRNFNRISKSVKGFLAFSKGRQIEVKLNDPTNIAKEVVELYRNRAQELGVEIILEQKDNMDSLLIDYEGIHESLTNLVGNAIDACEMSEADHGRVLVRTSENADFIIYEVIDNGCGMNSNVKRKIFGNFFTTKGLGGTGLGLLMTKRIVEEHGGTIDFESKLNKGTSFRVKLPKKQPSNK